MADKKVAKKEATTTPEKKARGFVLKQFSKFGSNRPPRWLTYGSD